MKIIKIAKLSHLEIQYTGLLSPESVQNGIETPWTGLIERFDIPDGWTTHGHHMTINLGPNKDFGKTGGNVRVRVQAIGKNDKAIALLVESGLLTKNKNTHITLATSPDGQPKDSNDITNWEPIPPMSQFSLDASIEEVGPGGVIITDEMREQEKELVEKERIEKQREQDEKKAKREEENKQLRDLGFEQAQLFLENNFPNLPEQAILGKLKGAGLS